MLQELSIRNFAIIDDLSIRFSGGLSILSGETGTGKSILINAVNLLLGSRASGEMIRTGCEHAELEAVFDVPPESLAARKMEQHGYDPREGLLIRRVISRSESNRIYINGRLATMQILGNISENLACISGQHAHQGLLKEEQHLLILDQFDGLMPLRAELNDRYHAMQPMIEALAKLKEMKKSQSEHLELLQFQRDEIEAAALTAGEDGELERERIRLKNSALLMSAVHGSIAALYDHQGAVTEQLAAVRKELEKAGRIDPTLVPFTENLYDIGYRLEELTDALRGYLTGVQVDENRLVEVEERLDRLNKLKRKYGGSLTAVFEHLDTIGRELQEIENVDEQIEAMEDRLSAQRRELTGLAESLSEKRRDAAAQLKSRIEDELAQLNMRGTAFEVRLSSVAPGPNASPYLVSNGRMVTECGWDRAGFFIAPNVGEHLKPLASIASGGELSRIVLAIKAILAKTDALETVIFDEVDAGIGGGTAEVVGEKLCRLAAVHQVVCITHLPQIAKFGDHHFSISKVVRKGRTRTELRLLDKEGRIEEIARMLGGVEITPATLAHAREMLERSK